MKKVELRVKRTNGNIETLDVTKKFINLNSDLLCKIRKATKDAGNGEVLDAVVTIRKSNIDELVTKYNNTINEGGEGYIPPENYFTSKPEFKTWNETTTIK